MNENNIFSKLKRKYKATTYSDHNFNVAPNLLKQEFTVNQPNKVYVGDITYIGTDEGWLYLATVVDLFNREVVGWSMDATMTRKLVIVAFNAAIDKENPKEGLIFHSDRGVQYASYDYQDLLRSSGFIQSMSAKGCCYDNACAESFFSSLKKDKLYGRRFKTRRAEARMAVVEYIELFYNSRRLHSTFTENNYLRILKFEEMNDEWLDFIAKCRSGFIHDYDTVGLCKYNVPSVQAIGKVYQRLIISIILEQDNLEDIVFIVFNSFISDEISDFNSSVYYSNPDYLKCSYLEGRLLD